MATGVVAIRDMLVSNVDVAGVVLNRIYPDWFKQDTELPAICLWTVSSKPFDCMEGSLGMEANNIRVECLGKTRSEADALWLKVNKALVQQNKHGVYGGVNVQSMTQSTGSYHIADRPYDGSDRWIYRTIQSFEIYYHLYL